MKTKQKALGVSVLRLGCHKQNRRVWIVNKTLEKIFPAGQNVRVDYHKQEKMIVVNRVDFGANHTISSRKNGTPILDIKNMKVAETLGNIERIEVVYLHDQLVIRVAKVEKQRQDREKKRCVNTFELFSGAGTLSHFFKRAGFQVRGGLELVDDYRALFHKNNDTDEIYSIGGRIEDIHTSYFPKDIDVVLSGIPCTNYSSSNVKLKAAQKAKREGREYDKEAVNKEYEAEALTFYVLTAIRAMNPRTVVVEEVVEYSESPASMMLRTVLEQMGYKTSEIVSQGTHTKRERWVLVANMGKQIALNGLIEDDGKKIEDFLELSVNERDWKPKEAFAPSRLNEKIGIRSCTPNDTKTNTFTTHSTRGTEPILKHPTQELYSEFTNREIANIHGIDSSFVLDERKSISRQILGQGVTDMFLKVAQRIIEGYIDEHVWYKLHFSNGSSLICREDEVIKHITSWSSIKNRSILSKNINEAIREFESLDKRNYCIRYKGIDELPQQYRAYAA